MAPNYTKIKCSKKSFTNFIQKKISMTLTTESILIVVFGSLAIFLLILILITWLRYSPIEDCDEMEDDVIEEKN